jgi:hypothetical protein
MRSRLLQHEQPVQHAVRLREVGLSVAVSGRRSDACDRDHDATARGRRNIECDRDHSPFGTLGKSLGRSSKQYHLYRALGRQTCAKTMQIVGGPLTRHRPLKKKQDLKCTGNFGASLEASMDTANRTSVFQAARPNEAEKTRTQWMRGEACCCEALIPFVRRPCSGSGHCRT